MDCRVKPGKDVEAADGAQSFSKWCINALCGSAGAVCVPRVPGESARLMAQFLEGVMDTEKKPDAETTDQPKPTIGDVVGDLVVSGATVLANSAAKAVVSRVKKAAATSAPVKAVAKVVKKAKKSAAGVKAAKTRKAKKAKKASKKSGAKKSAKKTAKKSAKKTTRKKSAKKSRR
jgi:hypothetical protein